MFKQFFLLGALLVLVVGCGGSTSESHTAAAQLYIEQGDNDGAIIELKNALQLDGSNAMARFQLGEIYLQNGQILEAEKELNRAAQLGIGDEQLQPVLANILLPLRKFEELEAIDTQGLTDKSAAQVLAVQALGKMANGELDAAAELLQQSLAKNPASIPAMIAKARLHGAKSELSTMREQLQDVLRLEPENSEAWALIGDIEQQQGRQDLAMTAYGTAIEYGKRPLEARLKRAFLLIQSADFASAQEDISALMKIAPYSPGVNYAQGVVYFQSQEYEKAITAFAVSERDKKSFPMALLFAGTSHFVLGNNDQAQGYANQFHAIAPDNAAGSKLLSTIILAKGDYERVEELTRPVVAVYPNDVAALNLLANALMSQGKTDEALDLLARVAQLEPESSTAQIRLGAGMLMSGEQGTGVEKLEAALQLNPEFQQADILLVLNYVQQQDFDKAIAAANAYRSRNPVNVTPYNLLGRVYLEAGDSENAVASFNKALEIDPSDPAAHTNLAALAESEQDLGGARNHYETILEHHEDFLGALLKLAALDARENKEAAMVARLEQAMNAHPQALEPRVLMARYYLSSNRAQSVPMLFAELDDVQKTVPAVLNVIALSQLAQKNYAAARYTLEQLERLQPGSAQIHHQMAMAQAGLNNATELQQELEKAIALAPDYIPARLALARLLLAQQQADAAAEQVEHLKTLAPDYPDVLVLDAALARLAGDTEQALAKMQQAFAKGPSTQTMIGLSLQYLSMGQGDTARSLQAEWVGNHPDDVMARLALAESFSRAGQTPAALGEYKEILKVDDSNIIALNNLGWYLLDGEPELALRYAERANNLQPDSADVLDTLALVQLKNGQKRKAERSIKRALDLNATGNATIEFHAAQIAVALGKSGEARGILQSLLDGEQDFAERAQARELLESL